MRPFIEKKILREVLAALAEFGRIAAQKNWLAEFRQGERAAAHRIAVLGIPYEPGFFQRQLSPRDLRICQRAVRRLAAAGLVETKSGSDGRRLRHLRLTPAGLVAGIQETRLPPADLEGIRAAICAAEWTKPELHEFLAAADAEAEKLGTVAKK